MMAQLLLVSIFTFLGGIHFYWAFGGQWGVNATFPIIDGAPIDFKPPFVATVIVGLGLFAMALFYLLQMQLYEAELFIKIANYVQWIIPAVFMIRAIGDFKYIGFFKSRKDSIFASKDSKFFSPLCLLIAVLGFALALNFI